MYDINFIGQRIIPANRRKVITAIVSFSVLVLGLTLASIGTISLADFRMASMYAAEVTELQEHLTANYPGIPSKDELEMIVGKTEPHLRDIGKMVDARIRITPVWERIAMAVPEGVWLTNVRIANPQASKDEIKGKVRSYKGVLIEGVALAGRGPEGDQAIGAFVENLKSDEGLKDIVSGVEFMGTGLEQLGGTSVVGFEITCPF